MIKYGLEWIPWNRLCKMLVVYVAIIFYSPTSLKKLAKVRVKKYSVIGISERERSAQGRQPKSAQVPKTLPPQPKSAQVPKTLPPPSVPLIQCRRMCRLKMCQAALKLHVQSGRSPTAAPSWKGHLQRNHGERNWRYIYIYIYIYIYKAHKVRTQIVSYVVICYVPCYK